LRLDYSRFGVKIEWEFTGVSIPPALPRILNLSNTRISVLPEVEEFTSRAAH
jgi:hypothetical protein